MDVEIREAAPTDIEELVRLHGLFVAHHADRDERFAVRPGAEDRWSGRIAEAVASPDALVLVADGPKGVAGCAYVLIRPGAADFGPERIGYLCDVYVEPDSRRCGLARRFLDTAAEWLRTRDVRTLEASWAVLCDEARNTWPDLGFAPMSVSGRLEF